MKINLNKTILLLITILLTVACQKPDGTGTPNPGLNSEINPDIPQQNEPIHEKVFSAASDTNVKSSYPDQVKGTSDKIDVWSTASEEKIGFIRYDLSDIKASAKVKKAYIRFYFYDIRAGGKVNFYLVEGAWDEKTLTYNNSFGLNLQEKAEVVIGKEYQDAYYDVEVTDIVQQWVDGSIINDGIAIAAPNTGVPVQIEFYSKENQDLSSRLFISYSDK